MLWPWPAGISGRPLWGSNPPDCPAIQHFLLKLHKYCHGNSVEGIIWGKLLGGIGTGHSRRKKTSGAPSINQFPHRKTRVKLPGNLRFPWSDFHTRLTHSLTSLSLPVVQLTPYFLLYFGKFRYPNIAPNRFRFYDTGETFYKFRPKPLWVKMCKKIPGSYLAPYNRRKATVRQRAVTVANPPAIGPVLIVEGTKPQQGVFLSIWSFNRSKWWKVLPPNIS